MEREKQPIVKGLKVQMKVDKANFIRRPVIRQLMQLVIG